MAAVTIRNLSDDVVAALKKRAKRNGRSMEAEIREALNRLAAADEPGSGLEDVLARQVQSVRRSVPMREVMARIAANPRSPAQQRVAREWAAQVTEGRIWDASADEEWLDPWERAEQQADRLREEQRE